ncbi:hypothetical protein GEMRC1_008329 [Eukaryota sp. GEM-RC1]
MRGHSSDGDVSVADLVECYENSSSKPSSSTSSSSSSTFPSISLHFQQSLLVLIHLHFLNQRLESALEWNYDEPRRAFHSLNTELISFFKKVGYVSYCFFESALSAVKVFFQLNTLHLLPQDLAQLFSLPSFFGADLSSIFLHVDGPFNVEEFHCYFLVITVLELFLENHNDLQYLKKSSKYFPRLKQLHVRVHRSMSTSLMELLKVNTVVTYINMDDNCIGDEGVGKQKSYYVFGDCHPIILSI